MNTVAHTPTKLVADAAMASLRRHKLLDKVFVVLGLTILFASLLTHALARV